MTDFKYISEKIAPIASKYGADRVSLFGSRARNEEKEESDYDFIISKGQINTLFKLAAFINELEETLNAPVDVITDTSNDAEFIDRIKEDEVVIYERTG